MLWKDTVESIWAPKRRLTGVFGVRDPKHTQECLKNLLFEVLCSLIGQTFCGSLGGQSKVERLAHGERSMVNIILDRSKGMSIKRSEIGISRDGSVPLDCKPLWWWRERESDVDQYLISDLESWFDQIDWLSRVSLGHGISLDATIFDRTSDVLEPNPLIGNHLEECRTTWVGSTEYKTHFTWSNESVEAWDDSFWSFVESFEDLDHWKE